MVTGIGFGNGSAISKTFAREGADLILGTYSTPALDETVDAIRAMGRSVAVIEGDVGLRATWDKMAEAAKPMGAVNVIVNNAAKGGRGTILEVTEEHLEEVFRTNLMSVYHSCHVFLPEMIDRGGGVLINISSVNGSIANPRMAVYAASKSALNGLTRNIALDFGPKGIRANVIAPGAIFAPEAEAALDETEARSIRDNYVVGRWGVPQDIANAALYLASDEASFVTGVILTVDGGLTIQTPEGAVRKSFRANWRDDTLSFEDAGQSRVNEGTERR